MRNFFGVILAIVIGGVAWSASAEIPYRYSVLEGFILTLDDSGRRALPVDDNRARMVLDRLATMMESDRYRIPTEHGRTLAWHEGQELTPGLDRSDQLEIFNQARIRDASRAQPASVLFLSVILREKGEGAHQLRLRVDWVDLVRGEVKARYAMDPVTGDADFTTAMSSIDAFLTTVADDLLLQLGPAPPRGYGEVPAAWLIEPVRYRIDFRDLPEGVQLDAADALVFDIDHYLSHEVTRETEGRYTLSYETRAPSWWLAERLSEVFEELGYDAAILPRVYGLRIQPAE